MAERWFNAYYRHDRAKPMWRRAGLGFIEVKEGNSYRYLSDDEFHATFYTDDDHPVSEKPHDD